jgi:nitroreductase
VEALEAVLSRRSVRQWSGEPIPRLILEQLLEAARWAPSGYNRQPWHFIVLDSPAAIRSFVDQAVSPVNAWSAGAAAIIVCCGLEQVDSMGVTEHNPQLVVDVTLAAANIITAATALGLGTCLIGGFSADRTREHFKLPETTLPVIVIALGSIPAGAEATEERARRPLSETVTWMSDKLNP